MRVVMFLAAGLALIVVSGAGAHLDTWSLRPAAAQKSATSALASDSVARLNTINPNDQRLAERLTLTLDDFYAGWRARKPGSTRFRRTTCAAAPKVQSAITGFTDSALFVPVDKSDDSYAASTTRVFRTVQLANRWFQFAGGGKQAACNQAFEVAAWKRSGYTVTGLRHTRESFSTGCGRGCYYTLRAWQTGFTLRKNGHSWPYSLDFVAVQYDRAVIVFIFWSYESTLVDAPGLVELVMNP